MTKGPKPKPLAERFWPKVNKTNYCWEWTGSITPFGYGRVANGRRNYPEATHRVSWVMHNGPIPQGMCVLHKCDNRTCVNPDHLFLGTSADNTADKMSKGRHKGPHLTKDKVSEIRKLFSRQITRPYKTLATQYGVSEQTIHDVVTWRTWNK